LTLREPHSHQSDVQLQGRDQKVSALSFHVTLVQMRLARCRMLNPHRYHDPHLTEQSWLFFLAV